MVIKCPKCSAKFKFDESKLGPKGSKVRCKKCTTVFAVRPPAPKVAPTKFEPPTPKAAAPTEVKAHAPEPLTLTLEDSQAEPKAKTDATLEKPKPEIDLADLLEITNADEFNLRVKADSRPRMQAQASQEDSGYSASGNKPRPIGNGQRQFGSSKIVNAIDNSANGVALAADATLTMPRPKENEQVAINEELYLEQTVKSEEIPPQLYKLREIDFDSEDQEKMELNANKSQQYAQLPNGVNNGNNRNQLQIKELKGVLQPNAPKATSISAMITRSIKGLIIFCLLLTLLVTGLVVLQGNDFNVVKSLTFWEQD